MLVFVHSVATSQPLRGREVGAQGRWQDGAEWPLRTHFSPHTECTEGPCSGRGT